MIPIDVPRRCRNTPFVPVPASPVAKLFLGLVLAAGAVTAPGAAWAQNCGAEGQRACNFWERFPSCNAELVERNWRCEHPACGRLGEAACDVFTRANSCDQGLVEFRGLCFVFGDCGYESGRPCTLVERFPSCDPNLVEGETQCIHPPCGREGEAACSFNQRLPSCDDSLIEYAGQCWVAGACGFEGGRACTVGERMPSCDANLVESDGRCLRPPCGAVGQRACSVLERLPSCDQGLLEYDGQCFANGACGLEGQRACTWAERFPSCDPLLVERFGSCIRLACGQLDQRPCSIFERFPSCDPGLIEYGTQCLTFGACGGERQRPCLAAEQFPSCDRDLYDDWGTCISPYDDFGYGACQVSVNGVALPGTVTPLLVRASYRRPWPDSPDANRDFMNDLAPQMGYLDAVCRADNEALVQSSLDTSACTEEPFVDLDGTLRCSTGSRVADLHFVVGRDDCKRYWTEGVTLHANCPVGREEIPDVSRCLGGVSVHSTLGLTCHEEPLPAGDYLESCVDITLIAGRLTAQCKDQNGAFQWSNLEGASRCTKGVSNSLGRLICGSPVMVAVPNLVGTNLAKVKDELSFAQLLKGAVRTNGQAGWEESFVVVDQQPLAGTLVPVGSTVDVVATLGPGEEGGLECPNTPVLVVRCADCNGELKTIGAVVCDEEEYVRNLEAGEFFGCQLTEGKCRF